MNPITVKSPAPKETVFGKIEQNGKEIAASVKALETALADYDPSIDEKLDQVCRDMYLSVDHLYSMISNVYERIYKTEDRIYEAFHNHTENYLHLPGVNSPELLARIIKNIGMEKSWDVKTQTIYASDGKPEKLRLDISL